MFTSKESVSTKETVYDALVLLPGPQILLNKCLAPSCVFSSQVIFPQHIKPINKLLCIFALANTVEAGQRRTLRSLQSYYKGRTEGK